MPRREDAFTIITITAFSEKRSPDGTGIRALVTYQSRNRRRTAIEGPTGTSRLDAVVRLLELTEQALSQDDEIVEVIDEMSGWAVHGGMIDADLLNAQEEIAVKRE